MISIIEKVTTLATAGSKVAAYFIGFLVPRKSNIWVFSEFNGEGFKGNSKYAYLENGMDDREFIWVTKDKILLRDLRENNYNAKYMYSVGGLYSIFRSQYIFCTHGIDVPWWTTGGAEIVQFWHGNALKKVGWENPRVRRFSKPNELFYRYVAWNWSYLILTSSTPAGKFLQETFRMEDDEVIVSGYPRNDALFDYVRGEEIGTDTSVLGKLQERDPGEFVFTYVPTYRQSGGMTDGLPLSEADIDYEQLNAVLGETDSYLLVKLHPHSELDIDIDDLDRILTAESGTDPYPLLRETDCLITDYSSIYIDYLLLDRPMIFFPYDLDEYVASRDLCFEYSDVTPGPTPTTFEELIEAIEGVSSGEDTFATERAAVRDAFHDHTDGCSSRRVFQKLVQSAELD